MGNGSLDRELERSLIVSEYQSLKQEILSRLARIARLQEFLFIGTLVYIVTIFLRGSETTGSRTLLFCIYLFLLIVPFIAFVIELICTSEQDAVFRAGIYIRDNIEKNYRQGIFYGWEDWLERQDKVQRRRTSDKILIVARRYVIIPLYCAASSIVAVIGITSYFNTILFSSYMIVGLILLAFFIYMGIVLRQNADGWLGYQGLQASQVLR